MSTLPGDRFGIGLDAGQARLVAEALAERPFRQVRGLVERLAGWAGTLDAAQQPFPVCAAELALILQALGELPYRRVYGIVAGLEGQLAGLHAAQEETP